MNTPSPLVPQGTKPPREKSSLYFKVLMILTVHVVLIGGMLLQGCKDTSKEQTKDPALTQTSGDTTTPSNSVATSDSTTIPAVSTTAMSNAAVSTMPANPPVATQSMPAPGAGSTSMGASAISPAPANASASGDAKDYVIAKGDTLGAIARRNSISFKALMDANPGVNPRKLKIGQKLQIPASIGTIAAASSSAAGAPVEAASDSGVYVVKSGDTLGKIARSHGTNYKKIMALNDLKTTAIHVGQKLKMPSAARTAAADIVPVTATIAPTPGPVSSVTPAATGTGVAN